MPSILFITNYPAPYRVEFFNQLGERAELTVLFSDRPEEQTHRSIEWFQNQYSSFTAVFLKKKSIAGIHVCADVLHHLKKRYDLVILGGYSTATQMLAIEYLSIHRIPFYIEADGGLIKPDSFITHTIKKHFISSASGYFSSGEITDRYFEHYNGKQSKPIFRFPFSSLTEKEIINNKKEASSPSSKKDHRAELGINEETVLLSVGQMIPRKGFDILLDAARDLPDNIGIYIVGGKPTLELEKIKKEDNLKNVHFIDFQIKEVLAKYYLAADVFVLPTREDIWGLVINEALSYGLPVISSDMCGAALELVKDRGTGCLFPSQSSADLHNAIIQLLNSDMDKMKDLCFDLSRSYTIEKMVDAHLKAIDSISGAN